MDQKRVPEGPNINLASFIADLIAAGASIITGRVEPKQELASGNTFTVYRGLYRNRIIAIKYFNFKTPLGPYSLEIAGESLQENLVNASHEIRVMTNGILRRCPNIATLEGVFFETEDPAWIRPAIVVELAYDKAPTLTALLETPLAPIVKRSLVTNTFDALYALHSVKMCHGDVKPDNILIYSSHSHPDIPFQARVSDFGFSFVGGQKPRGSGTEGWNAPECNSESDELLVRERAYGRDIYSSALVMRAVFSAASTSPTNNEYGKVEYDRNAKVNERMLAELAPQMLRLKPEDRPWMEDLRKALRTICDDEEVEHLLWSWVAGSEAMTTTEIEPVTVSSQLKGKLSSWLLNRPELKLLPVPVQHALFHELEAKTNDVHDPSRADNLNALFLCYHEGLLTTKNPQKAWNLLFEAARAGSHYAKGQAMYYIVESRDFTCASEEERRDWSVACLTPAHLAGRALLMKTDAASCEKGLRGAVYADRMGLARRIAQRSRMPSLDEIIKGRLDESQQSSFSAILAETSQAISGGEFDKLEDILKSTFDSKDVQQTLLQALLEYAAQASKKELMHFLITRFSVDALAEHPQTHMNVLTSAIFNNRNDAVTWMIDLGVSRKLFGAQLIFGRVVCNSTFTMTNTFIQACRTYYHKAGLERLLNEGAALADGSTLPPPLILSILSENLQSFQAILRYDIDVEQRYSIWSPLQLTVARGLPHFTAQLIEKGADTAKQTADDTKSTLAHVLGDANASDATNEDQMLWNFFDHARENRGASPVTPSQERRYTDVLLCNILKEAGVSFDILDGFGRLPLEVCILTGKLWIADMLKPFNIPLDWTGTNRYRTLKDVDGRNLLFYAVEDDDLTLAKESIEKGYSIDATDIRGKTVLLEAAERGNLQQILFCLHNTASPLHKDTLGRTAFTFALANGDKKLCEALVSHAGSKILLERTASEETFIHTAIRSNASEALLATLELYSKLQEADGLPTLSEMVLYVDLNKRTCLHDACLSRGMESGHTQNSIFDKLLSLTPKSSISAGDCVGDTPLHDAFDNTNSQKFSLRCAQSLLNAGANVNAPNELGNTPLHNAYQRVSDKQEIVDLLLEKGADTIFKNKFGLTASEWGDAVHEATNDAKKAIADYNELYKTRSRWTIVQENIVRSKQDAEASLRQSRFQYVETYCKDQAHIGPEKKSAERRDGATELVGSRV